MSKIHNNAVIKMLETLTLKVDMLSQHLALNKPYLTTNEAMSYLGCGRSKLLQLVGSNKIKQYKKGKRRNYYASDDLRKYLENPIEA